MVPRGLEPRTLRLLALRSNQLSYETHSAHVAVKCAQRCFPNATQKLSTFRARQERLQETLDPGRTRTYNPRLRRPMPYPLGHRTDTWSRRHQRQHIFVLLRATHVCKGCGACKQVSLSVSVNCICRSEQSHPATRNRTRDHLMPARLYSQMLYQLSYSRLYFLSMQVSLLADPQICPDVV